MGCSKLSGSKEFAIGLLLTNRIQCWINNLITLQTNDGFLCKRENVIRFGKSSDDLRTEHCLDIVMTENYIVDLRDPVHAQDAATKNYVDNSLKRCHVGYVPILEAVVRSTGLVASGSSNSVGHEAHRAFNHDSLGSWSAVETLTGWLQIKYP